MCVNSGKFLYKCKTQKKVSQRYSARHRRVSIYHPYESVAGSGPYILYKGVKFRAGITALRILIGKAINGYR